MTAFGVNAPATVLSSAPTPISCCHVPTATGEDPRKPARLARKAQYGRLQWGVPTRLSTELFAGAELVQLPAGQVLFRAGESGDGCYRIEDGLLKLTMVSNSGTERAFLPFSAETPSWASLRSLMGCRV